MCLRQPSISQAAKCCNDSLDCLVVTFHVQASNVAVTNLLETHSPYSLWATIHMLVEVLTQVMLPPHGSHG